ncbi:sulfatase family protein [Saccharopolyspora sp. NPDC003752]
MTKQRNVLWILCDELRADALSCYGNARPEVSTPRIDELAREGVVFDSAYSAAPVCVPARVAMLTGRNPGDTGIYGNEAQVPGHPVPDALVTFPELLADAGWATHTYGKEHIPPALTPWQRHDPAGSSMPDLMRDVQRVGADILSTPEVGHLVGSVLPEHAEFSANAVARNAVRALDELGDGPFLLRASFLQPHTPVVVPEPWACRYRDVPFGAPADGTISLFEREFGRINGGTEMSDDELATARRLYYGAVAWLDEQVGALLDALTARGLRESTVVVLTSDHGAYLGEDGGFGKHTFAPHSHRVPLIVSCPELLPGGQRRGDLASSEDLARTVLGLCGVEPAGMRGRDLFRDPAPDHIVSVIGYGAPESRAFPNLAAGLWRDSSGWPQRLCVRTNRYRLDLNIRIDGAPPAEGERDVFLADRTTDPGERINLADDPAYQSVRDQLLAHALAAADNLVVPDAKRIYTAFAEALEQYRRHTAVN